MLDGEFSRKKSLMKETDFERNSREKEFYTKNSSNFIKIIFFTMNIKEE